MLKEGVLYKRIKRGAKGRNRTADTNIFSVVLYRLSYLGTDAHAEYHVGRADVKHQGSLGMINGIYG
jgi:hypothetical protein